ncbi:rhomboid family intramembrane serine protease [Pseudonocardia sp.]|jgi:membrane associated rhomboid family serine protease|uniref:rhomboid family intramembrane serine protease n=1 Tax=Pseudonocardia sp. TaxID=60912 RepID=UPI003D0ACE50
MDATVPPLGPTPAPASRRPLNRVLPAKPVPAAITMVAFTVVLYLIELVDQLTPLNLDDDGIVSRRVSGLPGIIWAPLLHGGWGHLFANTLPFLVLGFLVMAGGIGQFIAVTALIWILSGLGVWLVGPSNTSTIGMSGVIFGWLVFLLVRGFFARSLAQLAVAVVLFAVWGSILLGVIPGRPEISWQGHLFGALAGLLAAFMVSRADRGARATSTTLGA